jgi:hypothetical protein
MKTITLNQMEMVEGGKDTDCSPDQRLAKLGIAALTGAVLGGPGGFLLGIFYGCVYDANSCNGWK